MMNKIHQIAFFSIITLLIISRQSIKSAPVELKFNSGGKFKIVQFTDVHFEYNTPRSDSVLAIIRTILSEEKPDLVVLTGDVVCSENTRLAWLQVTKPMIDTKTPWVVTLGNHDDEYELTRTQIIDLVSKLPYCLTINGPSGINGKGNYILKIQASQSSKAAALLYCFDSNSYSPNENPPGYDWIKNDQIEWYRKQSGKAYKANENKSVPALAFFHIPLPEYNEIIGKKTTVGVNNETPCNPKINSGLFTAMVEMQDIMGVFTGHDHDNNYIGCLYSICLAYGCKTGLDSYGSLDKGARIIELYEGQRKFETWIRALNNNQQFYVTYPDSFPEPKE